MSLFQMKYCTSRLRCAASARASRAARASRPIREFVETGLARMRRDAWPHRRRQRGAPGVFHRRGRRALAALGQTAARTE